MKELFAIFISVINICNADSGFQHLNQIYIWTRLKTLKKTNNLGTRSRGFKRPSTGSKLRKKFRRGAFSSIFHEILSPFRAREEVWMAGKCGQNKCGIVRSPSGILQSQRSLSVTASCRIQFAFDRSVFTQEGSMNSEQSHYRVPPLFSFPRYAARVKERKGSERRENHVTCCTARRRSVWYTLGLWSRMCLFVIKPGRSLSFEGKCGRKGWSASAIISFRITQQFTPGPSSERFLAGLWWHCDVERRVLWFVLKDKSTNWLQQQVQFVICLVLSGKHVSAPSGCCLPWSQSLWKGLLKNFRRHSVVVIGFTSHVWKTSEGGVSGELYPVQWCERSAWNMLLLVQRFLVIFKMCFRWAIMEKDSGWLSLTLTFCFGDFNRASATMKTLKCVWCPEENQISKLVRRHKHLIVIFYLHTFALPRFHLHKREIKRFPTWKIKRLSSVSSRIRVLREQVCTVRWRIV